jgi:ACS family hexuronate transporter-like MFS transporter
MDRAVLGVLAPQVSHDLSLNPAQFGIVLSSFSVGYGVCTFFGGWAADRFGPRLVLCISMTIWSILCGLTGAVNGMPALLLVRTAFGAWEAPWMPAQNSMLSQVVSREKYAGAFGITTSGQPIGGAIAGPIVGLTAAVVGWRWSFVTVSLIGLAWVWAWWYLTDRAGVGGPIESNHDAPGGKPDILNLGDLLSSPALLATSLGMAGLSYSTSFFLGWFPSYLTTARALAPVQMSLVTTIPWALAALGMVCGGIVSDHVTARMGPGLGARKTLLAICLAPSGLCMALVPFVPTAAMAVLLMAIAVGMIYFAGPTFYATIYDLAPSKYLGSAIGVMVIFTTLAGTVSPIVSGILIRRTGGFESSFIVAGAMILIAALIFISAVRLPRRPR